MTGRNNVIHKLCENNDEAEVKRLIAENPECILEMDETGVYPLHYAASTGNVSLAIEIINGFSSMKAHNSDIRDFDIINIQAGMLKATPLHWACKHAHVHMATYLYKLGADVLLPDSQGLTPFHVGITLNRPYQVNSRELILIHD